MTLNNKIATALWITIFCNTMCFFGYVYEEIVDVPNMFGAFPEDKKRMWTDYHTLSNPAFYHIAPTVIGIIGLIWICTYRREFSQYQKNKLNLAIIMTIFANILTGIAVTQINDKLFFGIPISGQHIVTNLATTWVILNFIRLSTVLVCLISLLQMFNFSLHNKE